MRPPKTLYICYFGLREPLVQTQVLPYLREIGKGGIDVHILTFEPENLSNDQIETYRKEMADSGIIWHHSRYHKWPSVPATFFDILNGTRIVRKLIKTENIDILHGRVHIPTLMGAMARRLSRRKPKLIFDIRGFFPEEYTDAGVWPENGWLYRAAKRVEKWLLTESDGFVVLTEKARDILFPESKVDGFDKHDRPIEVIPCCVDLTKFNDDHSHSRLEMRSRLKVEDRYVIAYVGSLGGWYLTDEMFEFFSVAREIDPSVFLLVLTQRDKETVISKLRSLGFGEDDHFVDSVPPDEIPRYLNAADAGLSFIKNCYSKQSSSPTKNAEYLACGLPIIANTGVGDVDRQILDNGVGVVIEQFDRESYVRAMSELKQLGDIRQRCRDTALNEFDLETTGGVSYRRLYERLLVDG